MMQRVLACVVALAPAWLSVQEAIAADRYPDRPIRMIVTFPPGGSTDIIARAIGPSLTAGLGQSIIIDNRPGAGGTIGIDAVAKAAPDAYVIGIGAAGALAVNVSLQERMPYDPLKDLEPVSLLAKVGFVLIAAPSFAAQSVSDVVTAAKANRGGLVIGHGGNGTAMHLSAQLFNHLAAVSIPLAPYRGSAQVATDVLAGHVPLGIVDMSSGLPMIKAGRLRALAVSTAERASFLPDVPTFDEAGIKGYESIGWFGVVAPAGTSPEVIARLNEVLVAALGDPEIRRHIHNAGAEPAPSTPDAFRAFIKSEIDKWAQVIALSGAKAK